MNFLIPLGGYRLKTCAVMLGILSVSSCGTKQSANSTEANSEVLGVWLSDECDATYGDDDPNILASSRIRLEFKKEKISFGSVFYADKTCSNQDWEASDSWTVTKYDDDKVWFDNKSSSQTLTVATLSDNFTTKANYDNFCGEKNWIKSEAKSVSPPCVWYYKEGDTLTYYSHGINRFENDNIPFQFEGESLKVGTNKFSRVASGG